MEESKGTEDIKLRGLEPAWDVNLKRLVERALDLDQEQQSQRLKVAQEIDSQRIRGVEQTIKLQEQVNAIVVGQLAAFTNNMDARQKSTDTAIVRKEQKIEERMEELEETMTRQVSTINESIAGIIATLEAIGIVKAQAEAEAEA